MNAQTLIHALIPLAAAASLGYLAFVLLRNLLALKSGPAQILSHYSAPAAESQKAGLPGKMGSREYRIALAFRAYGLDVSGWEVPAQYLATGLLATLLGLGVLFAGLPPLLILAGLFVAFLAVNALIAGKWDAVKLQIEKEIPTLLTRLSSLLKANPNLIETLDNVAEGLDPERPLKLWVKRLAGKLQGSGRRGLEEMQQEAQGISPSLLLAVVEIGRLWETGGKGYTEALRMAAVNMADLMETRSQASAVASGAWGTARTILLALSFTLGSVMVNPISKPAFETPVIQFGLLAAIAWAGFGYWQIRDLIAEVTE